MLSLTTFGDADEDALRLKQLLLSWAKLRNNTFQALGGTPLPFALVLSSTDSPVDASRNYDINIQTDSPSLYNDDTFDLLAVLVTDERTSIDVLSEFPVIVGQFVAVRAGSYLAVIPSGDTTRAVATGWLETNLSTVLALVSNLIVELASEKAGGKDYATENMSQDLRPAAAAPAAPTAGWKTTVLVGGIFALLIGTMLLASYQPRD
jgi:hypothetical protein